MDRIRTLESFVRVVKAGSFAAAASQSGVSRAIVSKHLQDLEAYLGARLFHRTTRRLSLTEIGTDYYTFCQHILDELEDKRAEVSRLQLEPRGRLKIMAPKSFGNISLAPAVADFIARYPNLQVSMLLSDDSLNTFDLVDNGIDLAVRLSPVSDTSLVARQIGTLDWTLCASPAYLAQHGVPATPEALRGHNCLVHLKSFPDATWRLTGPEGEIGVKVTGSFATNSSLALKAGVLRGLGIALLPKYCIEDEFASGALQDLLPEYRPPARPFFVIFPHRRSLPHKVRLMIDFLVERFAAP